MEQPAVQVYTVNGASASGASSLSMWLNKRRLAAEKLGQKSRKRSKARTKERGLEEHQLSLIQDFGFPEASNRIRTTPDGEFAMATGTYKPQVRVYDLRELGMKWERHTDAENVDFQILSSDWTKSVHLQNDRTVSVHSQSALHYTTRIPRFGRAIAYHFPSCDALVAGAGSSVYRLNLSQGRFLNSLELPSHLVDAVNAIDVNPAHQLFAFGTEGDEPGVRFWDPRSRTEVGALQLPARSLLPTGIAALGGPPLAVTALASHHGGLNLAVGTSTGHTLLYDLRANRPFATKDQGYGLPVKTVQWLESGSDRRGEAEGKVASADAKVVKIWDKDTTENVVSITPPDDINHMHIIPRTGLLMLANESTDMAAYYVPQLGPAPKWCRFLDNVTEEMEGDAAGASKGPSVWDDYKFVERGELAGLGLDHLVGTPALKPYMHGFFVSLELYNTARLVSNPFAYAEHREREVQAKLDKQAESRIRAVRKNPNVKVNKALAERLQRVEERRARKAGEEPAAADEDSGVLADDRFKDLFADPDFEVDEESREFGMLNPATAGHNVKRRKTAVEEEEEESDRDSLADSDESRSGSEDKSDGDSSDPDDIRLQRGKPSQRSSFSQQSAQPKQTNRTNRRTTNMSRGASESRPKLRPRLVAGADGTSLTSASDTFGDRMRHHAQRSSSAGASRRSGGGGDDSGSIRRTAGGGMEMSWIPKTTEKDDHRPARPKKMHRREEFGAGLEKGALEEDADRGKGGRTGRRQIARSASKNVFRGMS